MATRTSRTSVQNERDAVAIPLSNSEEVTWVSSEDAERVRQYNWWATYFGYVVGQVEGEQLYLHRFIVNPPTGKWVDHANHRKKDNRRSNLRICTSSENQANRKPEGGVSQYKGVSKGASGDWRAHIHKNDRYISLGTYRDEKEAARSYDQAALYLHGDFALTNFADSEACSIEEIRRKAWHSRDGASAYIGVSVCPYTGDWRCTLGDGAEQLSLGTYKNEEDAARAYDAVVLHRGLSRLTNFADSEAASAEEVRRRALKAKGKLPTSDHVGVCYVKRADKWQAQRVVDGERYYLGRFDTEEEAATAVRALMERLGGDQNG